jgi:hypothetical protein
LSRSGAYFDEPPMQTQSHERELLDIERRFWDAMKTKDAQRAEQMTDDGGIVVGAQGVSAIDRKTMGSRPKNGSSSSTCSRTRKRCERR